MVNNVAVCGQHVFLTQWQSCVACIVKLICFHCDFDIYTCTSNVNAVFIVDVCLL